MAAIHAAIVSVVRAGQTIVAPKAVYGTTRDLMVRVLAGLGIATEFVDPTDPAAVDAALAPTGAPVLYVETVSNPTIVVSDIAALAEVAHRRGAALLVDNTFASPYACRPIEQGADLVMHSATKYLSGHSDVLAGIAVGSRARVDALRPILVDAGGALAPLAAFLVLRGLPTLALRMERHSATALALAAWLWKQDGVVRVHYPGLPGDPGFAVASRQLDVPGGMLAFELAGGREAGRAFLDAMRLAERTASLGSVRTIISHPSSTTHRQLDEAALRAAGIAPGLLRCSAGPGGRRGPAGGLRTRSGGGARREVGTGSARRGAGRARRGAGRGPPPGAGRPRFCRLRVGRCWAQRPGHEAGRAVAEADPELQLHCSRPIWPRQIRHRARCAGNRLLHLPPGRAEGEAARVPPPPVYGGKFAAEEARRWSRAAVDASGGIWFERVRRPTQ